MEFEIRYYSKHIEVKIEKLYFLSHFDMSKAIKTAKNKRFLLGAIIFNLSEF